MQTATDALKNDRRDDELQDTTISNRKRKLNQGQRRRHKEMRATGVNDDPIGNVEASNSGIQTIFNYKQRRQHDTYHKTHNQVVNHHDIDSDDEAVRDVAANDGIFEEDWLGFEPTKSQQQRLLPNSSSKVTNKINK